MPGLATLALFAVTLPNSVVLQSVANLYSTPSEDAKVVSQAIFGANVTVLEQQPGWAHVRTFDDYTGWMPLGALKLRSAYATSGRVAEVQSLRAHIYRDASVNSHAPLITVPFETRLEVAPLPEDERWLEVRLPDDRTGYIQSGDVAFDVKPLTIAQTIEFAQRFLGLPYTWGGTSSFGYDCSGLTQMLCRRRGIHMPRDSQPQADWTGLTAIDRKDIVPGDLLYFGDSEKRITHTGMYIGDGKFISATTYQTPMVRIDDLNDPHWQRLLVAARRAK
jgi:hypothetical protein